MEIQLTFTSKEEFEYNKNENFLNCLKENVFSLLSEEYKKDFLILPSDYQSSIQKSDNVNLQVLPTDHFLKELKNLFITCKHKEEQYEKLKKKKKEIEEKVKVNAENYSKLITLYINPINEAYQKLKDRVAKWALDFTNFSAQIEAIKDKLVEYRQNIPILTIIHMITERASSLIYHTLKYVEILTANQDIFEIGKKAHTKLFKELIKLIFNELMDILKNHEVYLKNKKYYDDVYNSGMKFIFAICIIELFHFFNKSVYYNKKSVELKLNGFDLLKHSSYYQSCLPSMEHLFFQYKNFSSEVELENAFYTSLIRAIKTDLAFGLYSHDISNYNEIFD